ncbi:hypothetical protein DL93DRAFT_2079503 [Clavulina sp. PMI_390]|nr:hypothetical protein DL93DRAFT_2079503 [Clavulina sp. PMI_390]
MACLVADFVTELFSCPESPPPTTNLTPSGQPVPSPKLPQFVGYALHRTRLPECVTFASCYLLQRLKDRFPQARGSSGHRLFISAFMIASKVVCDDTYSNKSWAVVGQGMFQLREINQMEREMCGYLEWQLNIDPTELAHFTERVQAAFDGGDMSTATYVPAAVKRAITPPQEEPAVAAVHALASPSATDDGELESPSNSMTSSPASSALQTPPSQADFDGHDEVVVAGGVSEGISRVNVLPVPNKPVRGVHTHASAARW